VADNLKIGKMVSLYSTFYGGESSPAEYLESATNIGTKLKTKWLTLDRMVASSTKLRFRFESEFLH